jgi:predicted DsbA family dithiol-disulfide isomerase
MSTCIQQKKMKPQIKIQIISDVVCPWCYIGKRRIEKAMQTLDGEFDFDVEYLPFELNPNIPKEGLDQKEYFSKKFGAEKFKQLSAHVADVAAQEGLRFDFDKQKISPNTNNAHRMIWLAKQSGKQHQVKEALMKAYFEDGVDLTKDENLVGLAASVGMDAKEMAAFLKSTEGTAQVNELQQLNHQRGISGVPFYIINNQYGISGAQPSDVFVKALKEIGGK